MIKWTREQIIRQILRRESGGLPLTPSGETGVESNLYQAGRRIFGSWRNAVKAAGIAPDWVPSRDRWSPSRVLATIRALSRRRRPLRSAEFKRRFSSLSRAARRIYGSWPKAVIAAGVDPLKFRRVSPWTQERIIEAVLTRALKNEPLRSWTVRPKSLAKAAVRTFGSWRAALAAAGLDPKRYVGRSSGAGHGAASPTPASLQPQRAGSTAHVQSPLTRGNANRDGLERPTPRWSHAEVLQAILSRLREHRPMNAVAVRRDDKSLYWASRKRYRSWRGALLAAGLNPDEFRKHGGRTARQTAL